MARRYHDEQWLREKYCEEGWTQREIAEECTVSSRTIRTYMNQYGIETRDIEGENHPLHGTERDEETKQQISEALSGRTLSEEWRKRIAAAHEGTSLPEAVRERISESLTGITRSEQTRQKMSDATSGPDNPNWRGGYSNRYGSGWSIVRDRIRARDEVCQHCGHDGSEYRLEVHHIIPVRLFRDVDDATVSDAHDPENLVLLCNHCHPKADHGLLGFETEIPLPDGAEPRDSA
jgi:5-methylcytosine-specific restriction endonuclease McrA